MNKSKVFSGRSLLIILVWMGVFALLFNVGIYWGMGWLSLLLSTGTGTVLSFPAFDIQISLQTISEFVGFLNLLLDHFYSRIVFISTAVFFIIGFLMWLTFRVSLIGLFKACKLQDPTLNVKEGKKDFADIRMEQERKRRLFLHFFSVLQREGRLLDFFSEDLEPYDDEQIGAAIRSIHEDCKKTINKYLAPVPVIDSEEGETVEIEKGFDANAVKLTGNVSGEPPFKGVLRHRGWKASKKEIPALSDVVDASVLAPAEVEIE